MPRISSNNISVREKRDRFNRAVMEGMGSLPDTWHASIFAPQGTGAYVEVTIKGPETFVWTRRFAGPNEQEAPFVKMTIRNGLLPFLTDK